MNAVRSMIACGLLLSVVGQAGCTQSERSPDVSLLLEGGPITRETDEAALRRTFGDSSVKERRIEIGEGETLPGTVLFPDDSTRHLMILWSDTLARRGPTRLIIRGDSSQWSLQPGISLGTSLERLEQLNGRPFTLAGFGWDYSGIVTDWRGGNLAIPLRHAKIYLMPPAATWSTPAYSRVLGDRAYASDLPAMRALKPSVYQIFYDPTDDDGG